jgi:hypothetical protein
VRRKKEREGEKKEREGGRMDYMYDDRCGLRIINLKPCHSGSFPHIQALNSRPWK